MPIMQRHGACRRAIYNLGITNHQCGFRVIPSQYNPSLIEYVIRVINDQLSIGGKVEQPPL